MWRLSHCSVLWSKSPTVPHHKQVKTNGENYLQKQLEWGLPWVEVVHRIILPFASKKALITAGMTCKDWGMSGRIHSQWHCSAASQSLHTSHPSKKCHPLWSPQHSPKSTPLRSLQLKHTTKLPSANIGRPFLSVSPSFHLSDCLPVL